MGQISKPAGELSPNSLNEKEVTKDGLFQSSALPAPGTGLCDFSLTVVVLRDIQFVKSFPRTIP